MNSWLNGWLKHCNVPSDHVFSYTLPVFEIPVVARRPEQNLRYGFSVWFHANFVYMSFCL